MSLLSLPERFLQRLVELPLELFSMVLGSQKLLTDRKFSIFGDPASHYRYSNNDRYQTEANARGVRLRRKRESHRARHAGEYYMPESDPYIWELWRWFPLNWLRMWPPPGFGTLGYGILDSVLRW